jgi:hypothetical protein
MSFLDRQDYGEKILDMVFMDVVFNLKDEVLVLATALFKQTHPFLIWKNFQKSLIASSVMGDSERLKLLKSIEYFLFNFSVEEVEILRIHLPLFYYTCSEITKELSITLSPKELSPYFPLLKIISSKLSRESFTNLWNLTNFKGSNPETPTSAIEPLEIQFGLSTVKLVYEITKEKASRAKLNQIVVGKPTLILSFENICSIVPVFVKVFKSEYTNDDVSNWKVICRLIKSHIESGSITSTQWIEEYCETCINTNDFTIFEPGINVLISINTFLQTSFNFKCLFEKLWLFLTPSDYKIHKPIIQIIIELSQFLSIKAVEELITDSIQTTDINLLIQNLFKFGIIWKHFEGFPHDFNFTNPLFMVYNSMTSTNSTLLNAAKLFNRQFVLSEIKFIYPLFLIITHRDINIIRIGEEVFYEKHFNQAQVEYALKIFCVLLEEKRFSKSLCSKYVANQRLDRILQWRDVLKPISKNNSVMSPDSKNNGVVSPDSKKVLSTTDPKCTPVSSENDTYLEMVMIIASTFIITKYQPEQLTQSEKLKINDIRVKSITLLHSIFTQIQTLPTKTLVIPTYLTLWSFLKSSIGSDFEYERTLLETMKTATQIIQTIDPKLIFKDSTQDFQNIFSEALSNDQCDLFFWIESLKTVFVFMEDVKAFVYIACNRIYILTTQITNANDYDILQLLYLVEFLMAKASVELEGVFAVLFLVMVKLGETLFSKEIGIQIQIIFELLFAQYGLESVEALIRIYTDMEFKTEVFYIN